MSELHVAPIERMCIDVLGADAAKYLHSQLSNDIADLRPLFSEGAAKTRAGSVYSFVLEPNGKIVALMRVTRVDPESFIIDFDDVPGLADVLLERLSRFKIRVAVEFSSGRRQGIAIRSVGSESSADAVVERITDSDDIVVDAWWGDGRAVDVLSRRVGESVDVPTTLDRLSDIGAVLVSTSEIDSARVRAGWPEMGKEILTGETLVAATGITQRAVSFTKGCYPGQELVERMDSRGASAPRILRRLTRQELPGDRPREISSGDVLVIDGVDVGWVTSVAGDDLLAYVARGVDLGRPVNPGDREP